MNSEPFTICSEPNPVLLRKLAAQLNKVASVMEMSNTDEIVSVQITGPGDEYVNVITTVKTSVTSKAKGENGG